jgi:cytochrome oxidase Cu insertion factor (SCO1/SenC/PrrC family)
MNSVESRLPWLAGIGLLLIILTLSLAFLLATAKREIGQRQNLPALGEIPDFSLTNQNFAPVSLADLRGHVWVADIIFTTCTGPCLRMSRQMKELQDALPPSSKAKLVSLTTNPEFDTPSVLAKYAWRFDADTNRWMFLTGTKTNVALFAANGLKLSAVEKTPEQRLDQNDLFIHSTRFVIVDKRGQLRGVFDTEGEGNIWQNEKKKILAAIKQLEREP